MITPIITILFIITAYIEILFAQRLIVDTTNGEFHKRDKWERDISSLIVC